MIRTTELTITPQGEVCPSEGVLVGIYDAIKSGDLKAPEVG